MSFSSPLASELRAAQVGARRGAHVGERAAGLERQAGSRGSAPSPSLLLSPRRRGSSRRAAPAAPALPRLFAARRGCLGGRDRLLLLLGGAGRGGAEGGGQAWGAGGEGALRCGRESGSRRASGAFLRSSSAPRSPPVRPPDAPTGDRQRPEAASAARLAALAALATLLRASRTPRRPARVCVCVGGYYRGLRARSRVLEY